MYASVNRSNLSLNGLLALCLLFMLVWGGRVDAQCPVPSGWQSYTVVRGDNLYRIARRYGTTVANLQAGNCLSGTAIRAGQTLYVPGSGNPGNPTSVPGGVSWRSTPATYQRFERGFMIWRADTGDIWVYVSGSRNRLNVHTVAEYGALASNSSPATGGFVQPIMGFGKVWVNLNDYRQTLGWATQSEQSYSLRFGILNSLMVEFNLPDGTAMLRHSDGFWSGIGSATPVPSGSTIVIEVPTVAMTVSSSGPFTVSGQAAGLFEASFVLELYALPANTLLASQIVTYSAPDFQTLAPWQTTLSSGGYFGPADIRAVYIQPRDGSRVVLASVLVRILP
jgi:LysM repeat protein